MSEKYNNYWGSVPLRPGVIRVKESKTLGEWCELADIDIDNFIINSHFSSEERLTKEEFCKKYLSQYSILGRDISCTTMQFLKDNDPERLKFQVELLVERSLNNMINNAQNCINTSTSTTSIFNEDVSNQIKKYMQLFANAVEDYSSNINLLKDLSTDKERAKIEMLELFSQNIYITHIDEKEKDTALNILNEIKDNTQAKINSDYTDKSIKEKDPKSKEHQYISLETFSKMDKEITDLEKMNLKYYLLTDINKATQKIEGIKEKYDRYNEITEYYENIKPDNLEEYENAIQEIRILRGYYQRLQNDIVDGIDYLCKLGSGKDIMKFKALKEEIRYLGEQEFPYGFKTTSEVKKERLNFINELVDEYGNDIRQEKINSKKHNEQEEGYYTLEDFQEVLKEYEESEKEKNQEENSLTVVKKRRNPFSWIKNKVSNLLKRFSKKEKTENENNNDTRSAEKDDFRKEITGNGEYNTGKVNIEGLYKFLDSQEQQSQKDNINIENTNNQKDI